MSNIKNKKERYTQMFSALAVVLSLVFVGWELHHNTAAIRGTTMQAMSDASVELKMGVAHNQQFTKLIVRIVAGETKSDFTEIENMQLTILFMSKIQMLENSYLQHREGLVTDAIYDSFGWNDGLINTIYFKEFWEDTSTYAVSVEFMEFFSAKALIDSKSTKPLE